MNEIKKKTFNLSQKKKISLLLILMKVDILIRYDAKHALMGKKCKFVYLGVVEID